MTGTSYVKNGKDEAMQAPPTLCKGIELDAIRVRNSASVRPAAQTSCAETADELR
jgi:hypothetical protein